MRALVTGATGFIGSRLALRCLREGSQVVALGRRNSPGELENAGELEAAGIAIHDVPVEDRDALREHMKDVDVAFHLAAAQHEANVPDEYFRRINVEGTRNVCEAATAAGVPRLVYGSTIGVYGWRPGETVSNDSPEAPDNIYGITKLAAEAVVREAGARLPFAIARISETYGPGDRRLLKLFRGVARGLCLEIGPGRNLHHLVYVEDLIDGLLSAAREPGALGKTFVLAGREPVTTRAMLEAISRSLGRQPRVLRVPLSPLVWTAAALETALRPLGVQPPLHRRRMDFFRKSFAFRLDDAQAFGFAPRVGLQEGMDLTARWYTDRALLSAAA